eukprot:TRINITY_DN3776_c0_g1_i6.p1 TRINITY_DN3776_c0_g1~~TRINITY_DN3776_c0_g1_i6.p1  ORF type:complete len:324 (+),score=34.47 TRINITY_DN3776_c0_g1_i6:30-974(+)
MIRRPPRSTHCISSAASDVYKRQHHGALQALPLLLVLARTPRSHLRANTHNVIVVSSNHKKGLCRNVETAEGTARRKRPISLSNKEQIMSSTGFCMPNIRPIVNNAQGAVKKYKMQDCSSPESTNSTINHSLKTTTSMLDRSNSLFGGNGKGSYGQVAFQPKCKHIIITAKGNTKRSDKFGGGEISIPYEVSPNQIIDRRLKATSVDKSLDIMPLSSRAYYQKLPHANSIESTLITIHDSTKRPARVEILPAIRSGGIKVEAAEQAECHVKKRLLSEDAVPRSVIKPVKCVMAKETVQARGRSKPKNCFKANGV